MVACALRAAARGDLRGLSVAPAAHRMRIIAARRRNVAAGMTEPASLHPLIDASKCLGCGACVKACPEQPHHEVLGLIDGKAVLVGPTECIGHGACKTVCPFDAITLVFGTERRGLDIPRAQAEFRIQRAGHLRGRRTRRHGADQECPDAGPAGARGNRQGGREAPRRARCADRRRRSRRPRRLACREEAGARLPDRRTGLVRRRGVSISARQAGDDRTGGIADRRQGPFSQHLQGKAAEILDRRLQEQWLETSATRSAWRP